jgi:hypothetical protein
MFLFTNFSYKASSFILDVLFSAEIWEWISLIHSSAPVDQDAAIDQPLHYVGH